MSAVLDSEEVAEAEVTEVEQTEVTEDADIASDELENQETDTEDELIVTIGDEVAPASEDEEKKANPWETARELAKEKAELLREKKELKKRLETLQPPEPEVTKPEAKPTLESCGYDEEKFESSLTGWYEQKRKYDESQEKVKAEQETAQKQWQGHLDRYHTEKAELKVDQEVEQVVLDELSETQQGILVQYASKPALMVLALGKNPQKAKELADIKDPIKFALALTEMERTTKLSKRTPPKPETKLDVVSSKGSGGTDKQLEKLREEASKSGDYSKVAEYKRSLRTE